MEPLRHVGRVENFTAVVFRRTTPQITNPGGLWMRAEISIHWSVGPRTSGRAIGAGDAAASNSNLSYFNTHFLPLFSK
jgi:hypothetical protein